MKLAAAITWFQNHDTTWADELRHVFGKDACNARYQTRGQGEPGTLLRALYEARMRAMAIYTEAGQRQLATSRVVEEITAAKGLDL